MSKRRRQNTAELREAQIDAKLQGVECVRPRKKGGYTGRCNSRQQAVCPPCARLQQKDHIVVAMSGIHAEEGVLAAGIFVVLTLTAPGNVRGERILDWNAAEARLWKRTVDLLRRGGLDLEYWAVKELQKRGAIHRHAILRFHEGALVTESRIKNIVLSARVPSLRERKQGVKGRAGSCEWGTQMKIDFLDGSNLTQTVNYLSKSVLYASKDYTAPGGVKRTPQMEKLQQRAWHYQCNDECYPCYGHGNCVGASYGHKGTRGCVGLNRGEKEKQRGSCAGCKNPIHQDLFGGNKTVNASKGWSLSGITKQKLAQKRQVYAASLEVEKQKATGRRKENLLRHRARQKLDAAEYQRELDSYEERQN